MDLYYLGITLTREFFLEHEDHTVSASELMDGVIEQFEEHLDEAGCEILGYSYMGQKYDIISEEGSLADCIENKKTLEQFYSSWAEIEIKPYE